jgi:glutathione synthase/RimK-type ligase-like ATP-grasp enzyme
VVKTNTVHILTRNHEFPTNIHLKESFNTLDHEVDFINPYTSSFSIESAHQNDVPEIVINRCGGLGFDDTDLALCHTFQAKGSFVINSPNLIPSYRNKDQQLAMLADLGLPIVPTIINRDETISDSNIEYLEQQLERVESKDRYILKNIRGQAGKGVIRVRGRESLRDLTHTRQLMNDQRYIVQPFFPVAKEFRIFFAGNMPIAALEKTTSEQDQKLNLANANFTQTPLDSLPSEICSHIQTLSELPLFFYCADWIMTSDQHGGHFYLLEVNTFPGIDGLEARHQLVVDLLTSYRNHVLHS